MLPFTTRQREILKIILDVKRPIGSVELAKRLHITPRQVNYSIKGVKIWLKQQGQNLNVLPGVGFSVNLTADQSQALVQKINVHSDVQIVLSVSQRQQLLALFLLTRAEPVILAQLEQISRVSRMTILKDLDEIETCFERQDIHLIRKPHFGIQVSGAEHGCQQALAELLWGEAAFSTDPVTRITHSDGLSFNLQEDRLLPLVGHVNEYLSHLHMRRTIGLVAKAEEQLGGRFTDDAVLHLALVFAIMSNRIQSGKHLNLEIFASGVNVSRRWETTMIYTLTLNPAVDRELTVPALEFDSVLRATESRVDFGGKGFNVSRLLKGLGAASTAVGFLGGRAGELLQDGLKNLGIGTDFVWVAGETRTNVSIVTQSHDHYIKANEKGPLVEEAKQKELLDKIDSLAQRGDWWVLAGSLPPGVGDDFYARIVSLLNRHEAQAILDASGESLRLGCMETPYLVKPNGEEARILTGLPMDTPTETAAAAAEIRSLGARNVVISMGKAGALLHSPDGTWLTHSPKIQEKNPIGAGDSMVGGLVWALTQGIALKEALGWGVASGAATASLPGTEVGSRPLIDELFSQVRYERLETA